MSTDDADPLRRGMAHNAAAAQNAKHSDDPFRATYGRFFERFGDDLNLWANEEIERGTDHPVIAYAVAKAMAGFVGALAADLPCGHESCGDNLVGAISAYLAGKMPRVRGEQAALDRKVQEEEGAPYVN